MNKKENNYPILDENYKLKANYHTHTFRCGHAYPGPDEDYVKEALKLNYHSLGFSDHIPYPFRCENLPSPDYSLQPDYFETANKLKEKYKGQIDIYLGYEAEGYEIYFPYLKELLDNKKVDYLILGNHGLMNKDKKECYAFMYNNSSKEYCHQYVDNSIKALKTGMFTYFAHPDIFLSNIDVFDEDIEKECVRLIQTCIDLDIPLEVNMGAMRTEMFVNSKNEARWRYPTDFFFSLASKMNAKCIFGIDAHGPQDLSDEKTLDKAISFARKHNLKIIEKLDIKSVSK